MNVYESFLETGHERLKHQYVAKSPVPVLLILTVYVAFVFKIGPSFMKKRKPFKLKGIIIVYNIVQIICNAALFAMGLGSLMQEINFFCDTMGPESPGRILLAKLSLFYFYLKVLDLLDTVFFVLRKKYNQVTFLHIYHHILMVFLVWVGIKFHPGGSVLYVGFFNTIAHVAMYLYYLMAIWKPMEKETNMFWKKQVTHIQLVQHFVLTIGNGSSLFNPNCGQSRIISLLAMLNASFFIYLFTKFYINTYIKKIKKT